MASKPKKAHLVLENGTLFTGQSFGFNGYTEGEIVFNTAMTGYQEILTDPSYNGQIVTMTYPLIGNYGCNPEDVESRKVWVEGFVIKELAALPFNWRKQETLVDFLKKHKIVAIQGVDTRKLTKMIRSGGAQRALITTQNEDIPSLQKRVQQIPSIVGADLASEVTTEKPYRWREGIYDWPKGYSAQKKFK